MTIDETKIDSMARRFLLGEMSANERTSFEAKFVANREMFEQIAVVEDELIEDYVRGGLSSDEHANFEKHYLVSERNRERVAFARAMLNKFAELDKPLAAADDRLPLFASITAFFSANRLAFGSAFAVLLLVAGILFVNLRKESVEIGRDVEPQPTIPPQTSAPSPSPTQQIDKIDNNNKPTPSPSNSAPEKQQRSASPVLALFAGSLRDGGNMAELRLPETAAGASLQLNLENGDHKTYRLQIVDPDGRTLFSANGLRARGKRVDIFVPSSRFKNGEFIAKLSGLSDQKQLESIADYPFRVIKK